MDNQYTLWRTIILFLVLAIVAFLVSNTQANTTGCYYFDGNLVNDITLPEPALCVETDAAIIQYLCEGHIQVTAKIEDYFYLSSGIRAVTIYLLQDESRVFSMGDFIFAELWSDTFGFSGLVDYVEKECSGDENDPTRDGRTNYGWGDTIETFYLVDDVLIFYRIDGDTGVFDFTVSADDMFPVCNVDGSVCVYLLETGEYQVNIRAEGKTFVIRSQDWTWEILELEIIE